jgi:hypothetical protein
MMNPSILTPMLALIVWTFVVWTWMYATRLPAMRRARIDARKIQAASELNVLPIEVQRIAHNYNHLHEQPTVFYALVAYCHLAGVADATNIWLAWTYVALRIAHSLIQILWNFVPVRFVVFVLSSLTLLTIATRAVLAL